MAVWNTHEDEKEDAVKRIVSLTLMVVLFGAPAATLRAQTGEGVTRKPIRATDQSVETGVLNTIEQSL